MTTLQAVCTILGQQGGTIHDVKADFESMSDKQRDSLCSKLIDIEVSDLRTKLWFFSRRNELLGLSIDKV